MHWSDGLVGYFSSYALGNAIAAQLVNTMSKTINIEENLAKGDFTPMTNWLTENIHKYGKMKTTNEIVKDATGEELNSEYYIKYLEDKYSKIYCL